MPVLVTGAAGFIGSNLVDELMTQGMEVIGFDNLSEGKQENLERWKSHKKFTFVKGDILDFDLLRRAMDHCTTVFHLAADSRIQTGITDPRHSIETNVVGTANVAEAARQLGVSRIVYSASSSAYGRKNDWVFDEKGNLSEKAQSAGLKGLREDMPVDCLNPYSMSKEAGEKVMDVYNRLYGISTVSLRYFNVYGPRHQETGRYATVIAIFRRQMREGMPMTIVGDGSQRRDFTFVGDIVRANMLAMMNREAVGTFNIGTGTNCSISSLAYVLSNKAEIRSDGDRPDVQFIPPRLGEARFTLADNTKAQEVLGWRPQVNLKQGVEVLDAFEKKMGVSGSRIILATR